MAGRPELRPFVLASPDTQAEIAQLARPGGVLAELRAAAAGAGVLFAPTVVPWRAGGKPQGQPGHRVRLSLELIDRADGWLIAILGNDYGPHRTRSDEPPPLELADEWRVCTLHGQEWVAQGEAAACSPLELCVRHAVRGSEDRTKRFVYARGQPDRDDPKMDRVVELLEPTSAIRWYSTLDELETMLHQDWSAVLMDTSLATHVPQLSYTKAQSHAQAELSRLLLSQQGAVAVLVGAAGVGKTATLAGWTAGLDGVESRTVEVNAEPGPALEQLVSGLPGVRSGGPAGLAEAVVAADPDKRLVLVVDGADRLGEGLEWLPSCVPDSTLIVISVDQPLSAVAITRLSERGSYMILELPSLEQDQVEEEQISRVSATQLGKWTDAQLCRAIILNDQLRGTKIDPASSAKLVGHPLASTPLFLAIVAAECRAIKEPHLIHHQLQAYLVCTKLQQLVHMVLQRAARTYGWAATEKPMFAVDSPTVDERLGGGWVAALVQLLAVAQRGLTCTEAGLGLARLGFREESAVTSHDLLLLLDLGRGCTLIRELPGTDRLALANRHVVDLVHASWQATTPAVSPRRASLMKKLARPSSSFSPVLPLRRLLDQDSSASRPPRLVRGKTPPLLSHHWSPVKDLPGDDPVPQAAQDILDHASLGPRNIAHAALAAVFFVGDELLSAEQLERSMQEYPNALVGLGYYDSLQQLLLTPRVFRGLYLCHFGSSGPADEAGDGGDDLYLLERRSPVPGFDSCGSTGRLLSLWRIAGKPEAVVVAAAYRTAAETWHDPGLLAACGWLQLQLGKFQSAAELAAKAIERRQGSHREPEARILLALASCAQHRFRHSREQLRHVNCRVHEGTSMAVMPLLTTGLLQLAERQHLGQAISILEAATSLEERLGGQRLKSIQLAMADAMVVQAGKLFNPNGYERARELLKRVSELRSSVFGSWHPEAVIVLGWIANLCDQLGMLQPALQLHLQTLEKLKRSLATDHAWVLAAVQSASSIQIELYWTCRVGTRARCWGGTRANAPGRFRPPDPGHQLPGGGSGRGATTGSGMSTRHQGLR